LPDSDADYDKVLEIDLSQLEPLVAKPHMPDLVVKTREAGEVKVESVFIGSCTNASYSDIAKAAKILKGRKVHKDISLTVGPGTRQVLEQLIADGILAELVSAGARILECGCGPCIGVGQVPSAKGVVVRTANRNFKGRCGANDAAVYLASPETAAATALTGKITDPREVFDVTGLLECQEPAVYKIDDSLIIKPEEVADRKQVKIIKGENIVDLPVRGPLQDIIEATAVVKLGDNITTDDIIPATTDILKYYPNIPKLADFTFCFNDPTFVERAKKLQKSVIIGGENYGQGSSREHAAITPMFLGVQAILAKSFARIHKENLINYGIMPLVFKNKADYDLLEQGDVFVVDQINCQVDAGNVAVKVINKNLILDMAVELSPYDKEVLKAGGALNYLKNKRK